MDLNPLGDGPVARDARYSVGFTVVTVSALPCSAVLWRFRQPSFARDFIS